MERRPMYPEVLIEMERRPMYPEGHLKACGYLSYAEVPWHLLKEDCDKYFDELERSRGYEVRSCYGRLVSRGVEPLLEGEMEDSELEEMSEFAIREHKGLPVEERHNLVCVKWVTCVRAEHYTYYFTMTVKDSTGKDNSCRAKILSCPMRCNFLLEYGLGPFVDGTTLPREFHFGISLNRFSDYDKKDMGSMISVLNTIKKEGYNTSIEKAQETQEERDGRMKVYKIEKCNHLKDVGRSSPYFCSKRWR